jgi:2'-5' RNA ligase
VRLFVALWPPPAVVAHAAAAVSTVRDGASGLQWVPPERWHLTLAFHGEVPERDLDALVDRTGRRLRGAHELALELRGAGSFRGCAVWLGVAGAVEPLRALAARLAPGERPYRPHLTVARLRGRADPTGTVATLAGYRGPGWTAGTVHLVRSRPGPVPTYDDVATWPLPRPPSRS